MKNRIICITLLLSLMFSFNAYASEEGQKDYELEKNLIDILSGGYELSSSEDMVTRGEFVTLLMSVKGNDFSGSVPEQLFSDVDANSELSGVLQAALNTNVIAKGAKFYPNEAVTYMQSVKMAIALAGYYLRAENTGGYPIGYMNEAQSLGLLKNIRHTDNKPITRQDAYILLYNTVHADLMKPVKFGGGTTYEVRKGENILSDYHDIYQYEGVVTANSRTSLYSEKPKADKGFLTIGELSFKTDIAEDLLGYNTKVYYKDTDGDFEIILIYASKNTEIIFTDREFSSISDKHLKYFNDEREEKESLDDNFSIIKNFVAYSPDNMNEFFGTANSSFTLIDNNSDGIYDVVKAKEYKYIHVSSVDDIKGFIYDKNSSDNMLDLSGNDCEYDLYEEFYDGRAAITLEEITNDSLLCYLETADKTYYEINVLNNTLNGKITSISEDEATIDGVTYKINDYALKHYDLNVADEGKFYLGVDGTIVAFRKSNGTVKYGWVVGYSKERGVGNNYYIKIFADDSKMYISKIASKITLDGNRVSDSIANNTLSVLKDKPDAERLVRFSLDKNGEISMIDTCRYVTNIKDAFEKHDDNDSLKIFYKEVSGLQYKASNSIFGRKIKLDSSTSIFAIPPVGERDDDKNFGMLTLSYFKDDDKKHVVTAYDMDIETGVSGAILITAKATGVEPNYENVCLVEKKYKALNEEGETCYKFTVWQKDGTYADYYSSDIVEEIAEKADVGDIIRLDADRNRRITALSIDYDLSEATVLHSNSSNVEYQGGYVYSFDGSTMILMQSDIDISNPVEIDEFNISSLFITSVRTSVVVDVNTDGGNIKTVSVQNAPLSVIRTVRNAGEMADYAMVYHRHWIGRVAIIYRYSN